MSSKTSPFLRVSAPTLVAISLLSIGCGGSATGTKQPVLASGEAAVRPVDVSDDDFSASLVKVLRDGSKTPERLGLLTGVVRRQLNHAQQRFVLGDADQGTASTIGAMYLLRTGEGQAAMIDDQGGKALDGTIRFLGSRGDEGRVLALMQMRALTLKDATPARTALADHLGNLQRYVAETHEGETCLRLGRRADYLARRSLVEGSQDTLNLAADAITAWIVRGIEIDDELEHGQQFVQTELDAALRSLRLGPLMLVAVYLRHGDAANALARLEAKKLGPMEQYTEPLRRTLALAEDGNLQGWELLSGLFFQEGAAREKGGGDRLSPDFIEAAVWGGLLEAYRKEPTNVRTSTFLAERLVRFGMSEGAAAVLASALGTNPSPGFVGEACSVVLEGMAVDGDVGDDAAVRRTFRAAAPILAAADRPEIARAGVEGIAARVRLFMATIEARGGNLAAARPMFVAAANGNSTVSGWLRVARVDRQLGDTAAALESIRQARSAQDARFALGDVCDANLMAFEIHRDAGQQAEARTSLDEALAVAMAMRKMRGEIGSRARAETLLGRVYDAYGETKAAKQAHERALTLALADRDVLGATVMQTVARALVQKDLEGGRSALKQGLDADIDQEDRIYAGLWLQLLQRQTKAPTDEIITQALSVTGDRDSWVVKLANWAMGKMTNDALIAAAQNNSQKVEAEFYTAMSRRVGGDPATDALLRHVANSPVIDLIEVQLAKDLLAPSFRIQLPASANAISP